MVRVTKRVVVLVKTVVIEDVAIFVVLAVVVVFVVSVIDNLIAEALCCCNLDEEVRGNFGNLRENPLRVRSTGELRKVCHLEMAPSEASAAAAAEQ